MEGFDEAEDSGISVCTDAEGGVHVLGEEGFADGAAVGDVLQGA